MNTILSIDQQIFLWINHVPHSMISDTVAKFFSLIGSVGLIWFVIGIVLFIREERKHHMFFVPIMSAGGLSYVLVEWMMKPFVARVRPTVEIGAIIVGDPKTDYSFPSGHATIAFAMAVVLSSYEPTLKWFFYALAFCISLSRVYIGVHYPFDVVAGGILGWGIGEMIYYVNAKIKCETTSDDGGGSSDCPIHQKKSDNDYS